MVEDRTGSGSQPWDTPPPRLEGFAHEPVMIQEVVALVAPVPPGTLFDATVGGGSHAAALLSACPHLDLIGVDRDEAAVAAATERLALFGTRVRLRRARFDEIGRILDESNGHRLSGFLFDLGVSSPQLDRAERGFSFRHEGPLDMRMDQSTTVTASDVVNRYETAELVKILRDYGDERFAGRIAAAIVAARPLRTTTELAQAVVSAIPAAARRTGGHPAKRTFQAIRIEVNDELRVLAPSLEVALDALVPGGRGVVLTYHSGEDRIVKRAFQQRSSSSAPPGLPVPMPEPSFKLLRPVVRRPSPDELASNPRARSARLRAIERRAA